jgi:UDP-N-acetylglucosamine 2-epimerase (non-hydrolysing)
MRFNTEQPVNVEVSKNTLVDNNGNGELKLLEQIISRKCKRGWIPEMWDGRTAERIVHILDKIVTS